MRFVHYIVSLGVRHLLTQRLRHPALLRDTRIAKTKANAFAPAPLSQVEDGPWMKMVPELKSFGVGGQSPNWGRLAFAHPYRSRALYTRRETSALTI